MTKVSTQIFRFNDKYEPQDYGKLLVVAENEIHTLYNVSGAYYKNPDYDPEEEGSEPVLEVEEHHFVDAGGTSVEFVMGSQITWGKTRTYYEDEACTVEADVTQWLALEGITYYDGSNYRFLTLVDPDYHETQYEDVTEELGADFEERLEAIAWEQERYGKYTAYVDPRDGAAYLYYESRYPGPDHYWPVMGGQLDVNVLTDGFNESEISSDVFRFFSLLEEAANELEFARIGENTVSLQNYDDTYVVIENTANDYYGTSREVWVFRNEETARAKYAERVVELNDRETEE